MAEKSMSKFSQYLAANDLKDVYFQKVNWFSAINWIKKYPSILEDTLDRNSKLEEDSKNRRNEFNKKLKYEIFKRLNLKENPENRNPELILHT